LGGISKKVKVFAHVALASSAFGTTTKSVIVQVVARFLKLVTEAVVGVFEVETGERSQKAHGVC
jgi:hypothetical protein